MSIAPGLQHRLTLRMIAHAVRVMPTPRKPWAKAMQSEIIFTQHDDEAFFWAFGCVWASYQERIYSMRNKFLVSMNRSSTIFLQLVIALIGIGVVALLLWEPQIEGVNAHATNFEIYSDPFILLVYAGSIPFFVALYQAFKVLGYVGQNRTFSLAAVKALRTIKYCALIIIGFVVAEEIFIMLNHGSDDAAGGVFMGVLITFGSVVAAAAAVTFERIFQNGVDMKSENDLTT